MTRTIKLFLPENIDSVTKIVKNILDEGGLVVYPSDTVYGLLVDATNKDAVNKLIKFKNRPPGKAISIFIADLSHLKNYVKINQKQIEMLQKLLPGPFTIILPSKHKTQKLLESENGTLGIRVPNYKPLLQLVKIFEKPITATSANLSGRNPNYSIQSLTNQLPKQKKDLIDLIIDAGKLPRNKPSTVVDLSGNKIKILRKGDILFERSNEFISHTPSETRKIGRSLIRNLMKKKRTRPIVVILKGELGSGKTEMTRGIAKYFDIDTIVSPTFVVYYEYNLKSQNSNLKTQNFDTFIHADLFNIQEGDELDELGLEDYLIAGKIIVVEWGEKLESLFDLFNQRAEVVFVEIKYQGQKKRQINIDEQYS